MADFVIDRMAGTNWDDLNERVGQVGATWQYHVKTPGTRWYIHDGKVHCGAAGAAWASGVPGSADYDVSCDYTVYTDIGSVSIAGRMSTTALTFYYTYFGGGHLNLIKSINGTLTNLDSLAVSLSGAYELMLRMRGPEITVRLDGVERLGATDAAIAAAGRAGVRAGGVNDKVTGKHITNFVASDLSAPARPRVQVAGLIGL